MGALKLSNISIKNKLLFVVVVPIIGMLVLAGIKVSLLQSKAKAQGELVELMDISIAASNLVHELQKERGASAGYTNSRGRKFADTLKKQRLNTNEKRQILMETLKHIDSSKFGEEYNKELNAALAQLDVIETKRKQISSFQLPLPKVVGYYTGMNTKFLGITKKALFIVEDTALLRDISAYLYFMQSKERAGIERAVGSAGFGGGWNDAMIAKLSNLVSIQDTYLDVFLAYATPEERDYYNKKIEDSSFKDVLRMRKIAQGQNPNASGIDGEYWFKTITKKINILKDIEDHLGHDVSHLAAEEQEEAAHHRNLYLLILGVLISSVLYIAYVILTDLLRSIKNTKDVMNELSSGNSDVVVEGTNREDEIGGMAQSIEVFKQGLIERKEMEEQAMKLQAQAEDNRRKAMLDMADQFDNQVGGLIQSLSSSAGQLQTTAESMRGIADETSQSSATVASSSEEASVNVNTVASAMEEMSAAASEIGQQTTSAKTQSNDTASKARTANDTVGNLNELVDNIGEVVTSIKDIAEQTNLLALNATIEAARAGEAGKGFAVVADEVKKLASETAQKTEEIENRITEIQGATQESVQAMGDIINNISEIDHSITGVSAAVEEQNATNAEIVRSVGEASQGVQQVAQIIIEVQRGAGETGTSADLVLNAATEVANLSNNLQGSVANFLQTIRSDQTQDDAPAEASDAEEQNTEIAEAAE